MDRRMFAGTMLGGFLVWLGITKPSQASDPIEYHAVLGESPQDIRLLPLHPGRIIQISVVENRVFALDSSGQVWVSTYQPSYYNPMGRWTIGYYAAWSKFPPSANSEML